MHASCMHSCRIERETCRIERETRSEVLGRAERLDRKPVSHSEGHHLASESRDDGRSTTRVPTTAIRPEPSRWLRPPLGPWFP